MFAGEPGSRVLVPNVKGIKRFSLCDIQCTVLKGVFFALLQILPPIWL